MVMTVVVGGCSNDGEAVGAGGDAPPIVESPVPDAADLDLPGVGQSSRAAPDRPEPVVPESFSLRTRGAALDFAEYAVEVVNYVTATGDVEPLQQISYSACEGCTAIVDDVRLIYAQRGWSQGGEWDVLSSRAVSDGRYSWDVALRIHSQRQRVKRSSDAMVEILSGGRRAVQMSVARTEDTWLITSMTVS